MVLLSDPENYMICPKCQVTMDRIVFEGKEVDRCNVCQGLWFDRGERELLSTPGAATQVDIGDAREGTQMNDMDRYSCPRCGGTMIRMVDSRQNHVWYEECGACGGSFFDAGEFRDLSETTISDYFKSLFTPERS